MVKNDKCVSFFSLIYLQLYKKQSTNSPCKLTKGFYICFKSTEDIILNGNIFWRNKIGA